MAFAAEHPLIVRVVTKTTTYAATDDDCVILCDATAGTFTVTTPDATSVKTGGQFSFIKTDASANAVTVDGSGAQTINGAATVSLSVQYQSITIASNGANWFEVSAVGIGNAPSTADYLVGTAQAGLSAEIVVGTTPGGELGGTWASPTVDATHSGSAHHAQAHSISGADHTGTLAHSALSGLTSGDDHTQYMREDILNSVGDLIVASANDTPSILAVGTVGQIPVAQTASPKIAWTTPAAFVGSGRSSNITSVAGTVYVGAFLNTATTETNANTLCPVACKMFNLYVYATTNTFDGTAVCTLRKNGAGTALTVTITAGSTATFSDTSNSVQYAAGDKFCLEVVENATVGTINIVWVVAQRPDVA